MDNDYIHTHFILLDNEERLTMSPSIHEIINITKSSIEESSEYQYVMDRTKGRAILGCNYVLIDDEIRDSLNKFSIRKYLIFQG